MLQPDLGTALSITFGGVVVMFLAGRAAVAVHRRGRRRRRGNAPRLVDAPRISAQARADLPRSVLDPRGAGYHITQSKIAIGSGGIGGKGFLNGTQSHLDYLPELQTDFIFATMAEEWGLFGGLFIILGFAIILAWGIRVALNGKNQFERLLAARPDATLFFYLAINMMMVMGLAPVVGIPLPLISYGGSAMMTVLILLGIIMGIARANAKPAA